MPTSTKSSLPVKKRPEPISPDKVESYSGPKVQDRYGNWWPQKVWDTELGPIFKGENVTPDLNIYDKLDEARCLLLDKREYLAHGVFALQAPKITKAIPTAAVASNRFGGIEFYFNPQFLESLTIEEVAFVEGHEAFHVLAKHVLVQKENHILWNICCDVIVNTWLEHSCQLQIGPELQDMMWNAKRIGYNERDLLSYITADDLYEELEKDAKKVQELLDQFAKNMMSGDLKEAPEGMEGQSMPLPPGVSLPNPGKGNPQDGPPQDGQSGEGDGQQNPKDSGEQNPQTQESSGINNDGTPRDGKNGKNPNDPQKGDSIQDGQNTAGASGADEHRGWDGISEGACNGTIDQLKNNGAFKKAQAAGKVPAGLARSFEEIEQPFNWERELERFMASRMKDESTWERPNRRLIGGAFKDTLIPGSKKKYLYNIVVYADMSGSIGPDEVARFVGVLKAAPPEIKFDCFSFDTKIYAWPGALEGEMPRGGGGTSFQTVVNHLEQTYSGKLKYDGVVVLTDGYDTEPTVAKPSKWMWVTTAAFPGQTYGEQTKKNSGNFPSGAWVMMPDQGNTKKRR